MHAVPKASLLILSVTVLFAFFAPVLAPYDPIKTNPAQALMPPSLAGHLLGDWLRDRFDPTRRQLERHLPIRLTTGGGCDDADHDRAPTRSRCRRSASDGGW